MGAILVGLGVLGVANFLPIWRGAGHSHLDSVNFLLRLLKNYPCLQTALYSSHPQPEG